MVSNAHPIGHIERTKDLNFNPNNTSNNLFIGTWVKRDDLRIYKTVGIQPAVPMSASGTIGIGGNLTFQAHSSTHSGMAVTTTAGANVITINYANIGFMAEPSVVVNVTGTAILGTLSTKTATSVNIQLRPIINYTMNGSTVYCSVIIQDRFPTNTFNYWERIA